MRVHLPINATLPPDWNWNPAGAPPSKEATAARDFEALLIGQMLRTMHEDESGWLGTDDDDAGSTALSLGEEQLAQAIAAGGGFGLAKIIASGLAARNPDAAGDRDAADAADEADGLP